MNLATVKEITIPEGNASCIYSNNDVIWNKCLNSTKLIEGKYKIYKNNTSTTIGYCAFYGNDHITSAIFTKAETIGDFAFSACDKLTTVDFPSAKTLGRYCFAGLKIGNLNFPLVTDIGERAFESCENFWKISFPSATNIGKSAFGGTSISSISSTDLPLAMTINDGAFVSCGRLSKVCLPSVTTLMQYAFSSCPKLKIADFNVLTSIGSNVFMNCSTLNTLILRNTNIICSLENINSFSGTPIESGIGYIYVPAALVDTYKNDKVWSTYASQFRALEDYPDIAGGI